MIHFLLIRRGKWMEKRIEQIEILVNEAHRIFNKTSVFDVIDLEKNSARDFLNDAYNNPAPELLNRYLDVIEKLRWITTI
jgi:hypothetical protein